MEKQHGAESDVASLARQAAAATAAPTSCCGGAALDANYLQAADYNRRLQLGAAQSTSHSSPAAFASASLAANMWNMFHQRNLFERLVLPAAAAATSAAIRAAAVEFSAAAAGKRVGRLRPFGAKSEPAKRRRRRKRRRRKRGAADRRQPDVAETPSASLVERAESPPAACESTNLAE